MSDKEISSYIFSTTIIISSDVIIVATTKLIS